MLLDGRRRHCCLCPMTRKTVVHPKTGSRPASSAPATFLIRRISGLETSSPPAKGLILRASALETHSAGPHSSRQPPHKVSRSGSKKITALFFSPEIPAPRRFALLQPSLLGDDLSCTQLEETRPDTHYLIQYHLLRRSHRMATAVRQTWRLAEHAKM